MRLNADVDASADRSITAAAAAVAAALCQKVSCEHQRELSSALGILRPLPQVCSTVSAWPHTPSWYTPSAPEIHEVNQAHTVILSQTGYEVFFLLLMFSSVTL